jgi:predicted DNA-binding antitoxin AbrB/MazE fold protein
MNKVIEAIYEDGVLKPLGDLGLHEHEHVRVSVEPSDDEREGWYEPYISKDPGVRQGDPCLAGTGIDVALLIAVAQAHNQTVEEIAREHGIRLVFAQAALDYYRDHTDEIEELIAQHQQANRQPIAREPSDPLVLALKQLSLTRRELARALMGMLQAGQRREVETCLKALHDAEIAGGRLFL